jgi:porin
MCVPGSAQTAPVAGEDTGPVERQDAEEPKPLETPFDVWHNARLTGDWWGGRRWLEDHGVTLDLGLTTIYQHNAKGGLQTRNAHRVSGSYDLELTLDSAALGLWKGGKVYALAEGSWSDGVGRYVGGLMDVNWDSYGQQEIQVSELWYEHAFWDEKLRVRVGKLDLRVDFDTNLFANEETAQFLNYGLSNTANIPFPDRGQGIQFVATPWEWLYFAAGVADADANAKETGFATTYHGPCHLFSIYELGLAPVFDTPWGKLPGHYRFGLWYDPQPKEKFFNDLGGRIRHAPLKTDDTGFYASFDQVVWREHPAVDGDEQGLGWFFRYGYAPGDVNTVEHFWSVGGQYQGLIPTRDADVLGFGVAQSILSDNLRLTKADPHRETALELYYNIHLLPWLTFSPDFQWVLRPGGENGRDAFVAGVRLQMTF